RNPISQASKPEPFNSQKISQRIHRRRIQMKARINTAQISPAALNAMLGLEKYLHSSSLEPNLLHLLKLRASQINGCAYCIDMHWKDLRAIGENEQLLYGLDAWEEPPYYTERERAAFAWLESLTLITEGHV